MKRSYKAVGVFTWPITTVQWQG